MDEEIARLKRESYDKDIEKNLMNMVWECSACQLTGSDDYVKTMGAFNIRCPADFVNKLLSQGYWTHCSQ